MKLSIIVVSYGVRDALARCLSSLLREDCDEIVVVDNASPDDSVELVRERFPEVILLALSENRGFSAAVNAGAARATGDALLLLNPDTELPSGALARIAESLVTRPEAGAIGFRQVDAEGTFQLSLGLRPGVLSELLRRFTQRRLDRDDRKLAAFLDRILSAPRPVPWVSAASMIIRRDAFDAVAGFDEGFFLYFEDVDFCLRLTRAGRRIYYDPTVTVLHHRGVSARAAPELASRAYRRSQLRFWEKHKGRHARRVVELYLKARGCSPGPDPVSRPASQDESPGVRP